MSKLLVYLLIILEVFLAVNSTNMRLNRMNLRKNLARNLLEREQIYYNYLQKGFWDKIKSLASKLANKAYNALDNYLSK